MLKHPLVVDNQVQARSPRLDRPQGPEGTAVRDLQEEQFRMDEHQISQLFRGYFNNKMTMLVFLIQAKQIKPDERLVGTVCGFLDDIFHHMFEDRLQKRYHLVFLWLKKFFHKLPNVSAGQKVKAVGFIRSLYDTFGFHFKTDI